MRRLSERNAAATGNEQAARDLRERATQMLNQMSPEQRREFERLARQMGQRSGPTPENAMPSAPSLAPDADPRDARTLGTPGTPGNMPPEAMNSRAARGDDASGAQGSGPEAGTTGNGRAAPTTPTARLEPTSEPLPLTQRPADRQGRERVVSEWFSNRPASSGTTTSGPAIAHEFKRAAAGAERAIEQQAVPLPYRDYVRRVFQRLTDRANVPASARPGTATDEGGGSNTPARP